jgi:hypothetical protein
MWKQFLALVVLGASVGWLAGLSVSPVAASIISGLLGLIGAIGTGALLGVRIGSGRGDRDGTDAKSAPGLDVRPAAVLASAIAIAVPCGIMARTYEIFSPPAHRNSPSSGEVASKSTAPVFYSNVLSDCAELMVLSRDPDVRHFAERVASQSNLGRRLVEELRPDTLRETVRALCSG